MHRCEMVFEFHGVDFLVAPNLSFSYIIPNVAAMFGGALRGAGFQRISLDGRGEDL